ncbi:hypothetical protein Rsub_07810 [Raphidocelis subcapitata]|uniref:HNH nuclease domain-containing protein n=1 Tax=Raphidocelis subcapitata TaxID=307507 RepID=A0A2V0P8W1_9CHLO|nr:hypothetical protein Rsub_07810 [Raphidocelis subcapitata]|eukprot:GBF95382.1 hypothetical protein Rsub_07810 [Raphidocelis subcapitata]
MLLQRSAGRAAGTGSGARPRARAGAGWTRPVLAPQRPQRCAAGPAVVLAAKGTGAAAAGGGAGGAKKTKGAANKAAGGSPSGAPGAGGPVVAAASVSIAVTLDSPAVAVGSPAQLRGAFEGGGPLGAGGEVDVAVADSDEELDSGAGGIGVAAGVLGAAGLAGVAVAGGAPQDGTAPRGNPHRCLVLDASYRPINTVSWFKAVMMDIGGKVDVLDYHDGAYVYSAYAAHGLPAVLRARSNVDIHSIAGRVALTRRNLLARDGHACQYCGSRSNLTLDHVLPVCRGGRNSWDNLVACCHGCNQRKGASLLRDLGWRLRTAPREPSARELGIMLGLNQSDLESPPSKWRVWLEPYTEKARKRRAARRAEAAATPTDALHAPAAKHAAR